MQKVTREAECIATELQRCATLCKVQKGRRECAYRVGAGIGGRARNANCLTFLILFVMVDSLADGEQID